MRKKPQRLRPLTEIDLNRLDQEWLEQGRLMRTYGPAKANAKHELAVAKNYLRVLTADLSLKVRKNPKQFGFVGRPNKEDIESVVSLSKKHRRLTRQLLDLQHKYDLLSQAVEALWDRREILKGEMQLLMIWYRSDPHTPAGFGMDAAINRRVHMSGAAFNGAMPLPPE